MMANSHRFSDERTRMRLLNRLGYFKNPIRTIVYHSSSDLSPSMFPSTTACTKYACPLTNHHHYHRQNPSILGDVAPIMVNINDEGDYYYRSSRKIDNETLSFESTSPTSCTVDISSSDSSNSKTHERNCSRMKPTPADGIGIAPTTLKSSVVQFKEQAAVLSIPSRYQYSNRIKKCLWSSKQEIKEMVERNATEFSAEGWDWKNVVMERDMYIDSLTGNLIHPCHVQDDHQYLFNDDNDKDVYDRVDDRDYDGQQDSPFRALERQPRVIARSTTD